MKEDCPKIHYKIRQKYSKNSLGGQGTALQPKQHAPPAPWKGKRGEPKCFDRSWATSTTSTTHKGEVDTPH